MKELFECAWREHIRRRSRAVINIIGYGFAVAIAIVLVTVIMFSKSAETLVLQSIGTHFIAYAPVSDSEPANAGYQEFYYDEEENCRVCNTLVREPLYPFEGFTSGSVFTKTFPAVLVEEANKVESIRDASAFLLFQFSDLNHQFTVGGFDPTNTIAVYFNMGSPSDVVSGRYIEPDERAVVMLHETYAKEQGLDVGATIVIANRRFTIVGIIKPPLRPAEANVYMTYNDAALVINRHVSLPLQRHEFNILLVEVMDATVQDNAILAINSLINDDRTVVSSYGCYNPAAKVLGLGQNSAWLLVVIISLSAIILAARTQVGAVIERRHDIGTLKLIGWTNGNVLWQILIESLMLAVVGSLLGCLLAIVIVILVPLRVLLGIEVAVDLSVNLVLFASAVAFGLSIIGGAFAGIIPAFVATRQSPADVLRGL